MSYINAMLVKIKNKFFQAYIQITAMSGDLIAVTCNLQAYVNWFVSLTMMNLSDALTYPQSIYYYVTFV